MSKQDDKKSIQKFSELLKVQNKILYKILMEIEKDNTKKNKNQITNKKNNP